TAPAPPANVSATAVDDTHMRLSWTASPGATSYTVLRGAASGGETTIASGITATSFTDSGLSGNTTYFYEVEAVDSNGTSGPSSEASGTTAPVPPSDLVATAIDDGEITLSWSASAAATSYGVWRKFSSAQIFVFIGVTAAPSFIDANAGPSTTWTYSIKA